jgi:hypothetical protein
VEEKQVNGDAPIKMDKNCKAKSPWMLGLKNMTTLEEPWQQ